MWLRCCCSLRLRAPILPAAGLLRQSLLLRLRLFGPRLGSPPRLLLLWLRAAVLLPSTWSRCRDEFPRRLLDCRCPAIVCRGVVRHNTLCWCPWVCVVPWVVHALLSTAVSSLRWLLATNFDVGFVVLGMYAYFLSECAAPLVVNVLAKRQGRMRATTVHARWSKRTS